MTETQAVERSLKEGRSRTVFSFLCVLCGDVGFSVRSDLSTFCTASCRNSRTGPLSPAWKGGRTVTRDGYVWLLGKKFEHRAVMEAHLSRSLMPFESVHHKNGNRSDNRIENLELWVTPQPAGQRPSDLVDWVLDTYNDEIRKKMEVKDLVRSVLARIERDGTLAIPNSSGHGDF